MESSVFVRSERGRSYREALEVCQRCQVTAECLAYALTIGEELGVYGGKRPHERRNLTR